MKFDLKNMNRKELAKLKSDVEKAISKVTEKEKREAREAMARAAATYGFAPEDLIETGPKRKAKAVAKKPAKKAAPGKPKYRNPNDETQTWTGKGRPPRWFTEATEAGATRESLAI